jgi:formate/nitrite transporter
MIQAAVFPIGLVLVIITGADLFTGNTMILVVSTLHRKTTWINLLISWSVSFFGNLVGCLFFQYILVYYAGLLSYDPYRSFTIGLAEMKGNIEWHQIFLRGIGGNWLVCLAFWLGTSARDLNSKIIGIYLPIWLFVAVGYEHSIANMFTVQMGMILGANLSVAKYILCVLIPVVLGNILGGGLFVGCTYWYLYLAKKTDTNANIVVESPVNSPYQTVKQYEDAV